jgi:hypothetical protein
MIKNQTHKQVIQRLKDHAKAGHSLGFCKAHEVQKLAESLERDSSKWFAASIQLLQVGFITPKEYDDLAR